ncbi:protein bicaudal C [Periplaneta americana]|uniref:protein bicaudal C n=1 Tax=Periplaneta americana TaxID=6978 RepID=UPI0037E8619E
MEDPIINNKCSDTLSEVSDGGTAGTSASGQESSYGGSNENLRDIAGLLGLSSMMELHEERFRVDRRKLEEMIQGQNDYPESADQFFQKIMDQTNTYILWPSRLKIGAKSRRDPHVRVAGRQDDVKVAKEKVLEVLDTKSNCVQLKLDVSYTDHSHIIGKGGHTIKRVMQETSCHIHFPDSNRTNVNEKSNQVSIAGQLEGVEQARAQIRNLTPLIFSFELPIIGTLQPLPDSNSPILRNIEEKYNVQVMFRKRPKLYGTIVLIKGCEWEVAGVQEATMLVIHHLCESLDTQIQVQMALEISPQHHSIVLGKGSGNLKMIMQQTSTQIMFPDADDPNIPTLKKSNICITGSVHNVYLARQQLMGSLPITLMFGLPENMVVDREKVIQLMQKLDVDITIRHKPKQNVVTAVIKGIERNASNVYEARNKLLDLDEPKVVADIPETYNIPNKLPVDAINNDMYNGTGRCQFLRNHLTLNTAGCVGLPGINISPLSAPMSPSYPSLVGNAWGNGYTSPVCSLMHYPIMSSASVNPFMNMQQHQHQHPLMMHQVPQTVPSRGSSCSASVAGSTSSSGYSSHRMLGNFSNSSLSLASDTKDSNVFSSLSSNATPLSSPALSPQRGNSPVQKNGMQADSTNAALCNMGPDLMTCTDRRAPGCERKSRELAAQQSFNTFDFDKKKLLAYQAMQNNKPVPGDLRIPTSAWSGYGFSQSSPAPNVDHKQENFASPIHDETPGTEASPNQYSPSMLPNSTADLEGPSLGTSNYLDSTPTSTVNQLTALNAPDMVTLLTTLGLEKYIRHFSNHEIDLTTFASLNDSDLREIGVTALGARRKLLLIISEFNRRQNRFCGSAAPGAERKGSKRL